jgi:threonylcarbamoyladenosine tRNA methylthiotransferase MtaB
VLGLASQGVKEVVLTGIHVSSYGLDRGGSEFVSLLRKIHAIKGIERIRLSSLEPRIITEENAEALASMKKICPHFHLSLQSGCQATLERMNRHYTAEEYMKGVELLRKVYDRPAITTDVIVGFPGETEEEFEESRAYCEKGNFYEMHVSKYSVRKGTAAEKMPDQLTDRVKSQRSDVLLEMTAEQSKTYRQSFIGEKQTILLEDIEEINGRKYMIGHTERYIRCGIEADESFDAALMTGRMCTGICSSFLNDDTLLMVPCGQ